MVNYKMKLKEEAIVRRTLQALHGHHWHYVYSVKMWDKTIIVKLFCDEIAEAAEKFEDADPRVYKIEDPEQAVSLIKHLVEINISLLERKMDFYEKSHIPYYRNAMMSHINYWSNQLVEDVKFIRASWDRKVD